MQYANLKNRGNVETIFLKFINLLIKHIHEKSH